VTHIITTQDSPGGSIVGQHQLSSSSRSRVAATHLTRFRGVCFLATNHHASAVAPPKKNKCMFGWYVSCGFHQLFYLFHTVMSPKLWRWNSSPLTVTPPHLLRGNQWPPTKRPLNPEGRRSRDFIFDWISSGSVSPLLISSQFRFGVRGLQSWPTSAICSPPLHHGASSVSSSPDRGIVSRASWARTTQCAPAWSGEAVFYGCSIRPIFYC
jgi:hypothetical protein